jgi:hypothetical protein
VVIAHGDQHVYTLTPIPRAARCSARGSARPDGRGCRDPRGRGPLVPPAEGRSSAERREADGSQGNRVAGARPGVATLRPR